MGAGTYDTGKIGLKGDGSGWVSNKSMSWDTSGNLQLTASKVNISGSDVNIVTENLTASGSNVRIESPSFFLGSDNKFISGSGTDIEISSSGFHQKPEVVLSFKNANVAVELLMTLVVAFLL